MRRGFTLLEVVLATIILSMGMLGIQLSFTQARKMMLSSTELETAQEVMDFGEMAYPLEIVKEEDDLDVRETRVSDLWDMITEERMSTKQQEKYHGYTWKRENLDHGIKDDDLKRMNNLYRVRVTVTWGERGQGRGLKQEESYVTLWRKPE